MVIRGRADTTHKEILYLQRSCRVLVSASQRASRGYSKIMFAQDFRVLSPPPPAPIPLCSSLFVFEHPSRPKGTIALARTHPVLLNFYTCEIQRKEINDEYQYLWLNSMCLLRRHSGISIKWTPLVHDKSVPFMAGENDRTPFIDRTEYYNLS